ncbi:hypothetical protein Aau02nite_76950 [Amorphoplanes auranticolor]|uniref:Uncharacterized protein n=2 Tax=Actinoplanes auranticolor TaxID=47988 RepID=A0A919SV71_9ACTN|nr:hypothetical protein Aau02nite_76950 [Actinoplanes auranticolor]
MTAVGPPQQPVTTAVAGAFIVVCAASAAFAVAVSDRLLSPDVPGSRLDYPPAVGPLLLTLAVAGMTIMTYRRRARAAALLAAIVAAQLAGTGLIAIRSWFAIKGFGGSGSLTATPITYAGTVALAAAAATVAAAALVWREPADGWRSFIPARPLYIAVGVAVVTLLPQQWNAATESGDITGLGPIATLTYSLPWGVGITVLGWMRGRCAVAAAITVAVAAVLCAMFVVATHMVDYYSPPPAGD